MTRPFVTALIDTYNHERFIEQAITSVLEQDVSSTELEVLVVDDGSTDRTSEIVRKFAPRVRYLRKENGGQASAFNAGIPETRGEIVAMLDGDDWWAPSKLRTVLEAFDRCPETGAVGHGLFRTDREGRPLERLAPDATQRLDFGSLDSIGRFHHLKGFLGTSRVAYRRSILERILPIPEGIVVEADEYLWTLALCLQPAFLLEQPLTFYRLHEGNLYMIGANDPVRMRRKYESLACLLRALDERLPAFNIPDALSRAVLHPLRIETDQHRLELDGGLPWEMFRTEREIARLSYAEMSLGYRVFKFLALALTLVLPPRQFCRLKRLYAARGLRKYRQLLGEPTPIGLLVERKMPT